MDNDIVITVKANSEGVEDLNKQLDTLRQKNKQLEDQAAGSHEKGKARHKETIDLNTKLSKSFEELGEGIIAAFAVERIIEFGKESVEAYAELTEATAKLKFAITTANGETEESFKKLGEQAENLSGHVNKLYSAKGITEVQTQLANYGLTGKMIEGLTPTILNLAAATGKSLPEATEKAIMAINGQTKGLRDIGVQFKDTGSKTENYNKLLEQTSKFSGAAEEKSHTLQGRLDSMGNRWEEAKEQVGEFVSGGFDVLDFLTGASKGTDDWDDSLKGLNKTLGISKELMDKVFKNQANYNLTLAKASGDGVAIAKATAAAKLEVEKNFTDDVEKLTDDQIKKQIESLEAQAKSNDTKAGGYKELDELIKSSYDENGKQLANVNVETKLSADKQIEILKEQLASRKKLENDDTAKGEEDKKAARDKALADQAKFGKDLENLSKEIYDTEAKAAVEVIKDGYDRKVSETIVGFEKEKEAIIKQRAELYEIINSATATQKQKDAAKALLDEVNAEEIAIRKAQNKKIEDLQAEHEKALNDLQNTNENIRLKIEEQNADRDILNEEEKLKTKLRSHKINQEEYDKEVKDLEDQARVDRDKAEIDNLQTQQDRKKDLLDQDLAAGRISQQEYDNDILAMQQEAGAAQLKLQKDLDTQTDDLAAQRKAKVKETIDSINEVTQSVLEGLSKSVETNIDIINDEMDRQSKQLDEQKLLAEKGLANDLAFEEKKADDLTKQKIAEQKKLKTIKEFETFLNSVAKFSETDPKTAIPKALGILAATKAAEAVFAEDGGIIGQIGTRSMIGTGMSRKHKSGNDVLLHAEKGEGILSVREMTNLGVGNFNMLKSLLKTPFNEKLIPNKNTSMPDNSGAMLERLDSLEQTIKNKKEINIDIDGLNNWIHTQIENGVKSVTRIQPNKKRI